MSGITLKFDDLTNITGLKSSSLSTVEELDLSGSKIKYFDPGVFSKLKKLKSLNLSNNLLKTIPDSVTCDLANIRKLDIAENSLTTLEFLKNFASLEELESSQNGLDLSQKFVAACFCPSLQKIDGKSVEKYKHLTTEFREKLKHICEKICEEDLPRLEASSEEVLRQELLKLLKEQKPSISGLPINIKEFMIKDFCKEYPLKLPTTLKGPGSPAKRASTKSPIPSSPARTLKSPTKRKKQTEGEEEKVTKTVKAEQIINPEYKPLHFIRCHSGDKKALKEGHSLDDPTDELTNVWSCAFEPHPSDDGKMTGIVATCGGCMVCLIDCRSGQVLKRFCQQNEQFFCLAWTTLKIENSFSNVLAVAGHNGHLKLIHPTQLICFAEHGNGRPNKSISNFYYSSLLFHPSEKSWLFCSSSDSTVTLFDIGIPSGPNYSTQIKQLAVFNSNPAAGVLSIILNKPNGWLMGGTNKGIMVWSVGKDGERSNKTISTIKRKEPIRTVTVPHDSDSQVVDGLTCIDDNHIACKFVSHGSIYVFNVDNLSRGPLRILQWHKTDTEFIGINYANGVLGCGDDNGSIWLYRIDDLTEHTASSKKPTTPFKILYWPKCKIDQNHPKDAKMVDVLEKPEPLVTNSVQLDSRGEFLVSLTDCNIVCIWKTTSI